MLPPTRLLASASRVQLPDTNELTLLMGHRCWQQEPFTDGQDPFRLFTCPHSRVLNEVCPKDQEMEYLKKHSIPDSHS